MTKVALVKTADRAAGVRKTLRILGVNPVKDKAVVLKPNFNTAHPRSARAGMSRATSPLSQVETQADSL